MAGPDLSKFSIAHPEQNFSQFGLGPTTPPAVLDEQGGAPRVVSVDWDAARPWEPEKLSTSELEQKKKAAPGDFLRGWRTSWGQLTPMLKGAAGATAATGAAALGEGGVLSGVAEWGLRGYREGMAELQPLHRENDDLTMAWSKAKSGDVGALVDWVQYGLGYGLGQVAETIGIAAAGSILGSAAAPGAGTAAGAVGGAVAKQATKSLISDLVEKQIAKRAASWMASKGIAGAVTAEATKAGAKMLAKDIGAATALGAYNLGMGAAEVVAPNVAEALERGEKLTGSQLGKLWGLATLHAGTETVTDILGINAALGRIRLPGMGGAGRIARAGVMGSAGGLIEGGEEGVQTAIERYAANKPLTGEDAAAEYINAFGLGAIAGGPAMALAGAAQKPQGATQPAPGNQPQPQSPAATPAPPTQAAGPSPSVPPTGAPAGPAAPEGGGVAPSGVAPVAPVGTGPAVSPQPTPDQADAILNEIDLTKYGVQPTEQLAGRIENIIHGEPKGFQMSTIVLRMDDGTKQMLRAPGWLDQEMYGKTVAVGATRKGKGVAHVITLKAVDASISAGESATARDSKTVVPQQPSYQQPPLTSSAPQGAEPSAAGTVTGATPAVYFPSESESDAPTLAAETAAAAPIAADATTPQTEAGPAAPMALAPDAGRGVLPIPRTPVDATENGIAGEVARLKARRSKRNPKNGETTNEGFDRPVGMDGTGGAVQRAVAPGSGGLDDGGAPVGAAEGVGNPTAAAPASSSAATVPVGVVPASDATLTPPAVVSQELTTASAALELVRVKDVYGKHSYVLRKDLDNNAKTLLRRFRADGKPVVGDGNTRLHRDNIDNDGSKTREAWKSLSVIDNGGVGFDSEAAVVRDIRKVNQNPEEFDIRNKEGRWFAVRHRSPEQPVATPVAESLALPPEGSDAGVAPGQGGGGPVIAQPARPGLERLREALRRKRESAVDRAAHAGQASPKNALPQPSVEQIKGGNAKLGHPTIGGLEVSIENPVGSIRKDIHNDPPKWQTTMRAHYGYIKGVPARAPDKEHVDVFVKEGTPENYAGPVFVIDQNKGNGQFDEPKILMGYANQTSAVLSYLRHYEKGWTKRIRGVTRMEWEQFKAELQDAEAFRKPHVADLVRDLKYDAKPSLAERVEKAKKPAAETQPASRETKAPESDPLPDGVRTIEGAQARAAWDKAVAAETGDTQKMVQGYWQMMIELFGGDFDAVPGYAKMVHSEITDSLRHGYLNTYSFAEAVEHFKKVAADYAKRIAAEPPLKEWGAGSGKEGMARDAIRTAADYEKKLKALKDGTARGMVEWSDRLFINATQAVPALDAAYSGLVQRYEQKIAENKERAQRFEREIDEEAAAAHAATFRPASDEELRKKPTPAAIQSWFQGLFSGNNVWTNGHLVDLAGDPHTANFRHYIDKPRFGKDQEQYDIDRVVPRKRGAEMHPLAVQKVLRDTESVVFESGQNVVGIDLRYVRYFQSKHAGKARFFDNEKNPGMGPVLVVVGDQTVGVVMPMKLDRKLTVEEVRGYVGAQSTPSQPIEASEAQPVAEREPPVREPQAELRSAGEPQSTTEDAGEELTANRRNKLARGLKWEDIADKDEALRVKETTKAKVYPRPDYEALIAGGVRPEVAHIVKQVYDSISTAPQTRGSPTDSQLQDFIAGVNRVMDGTMAWATDAEKAGAFVERLAQKAAIMAKRTFSLSDLGAKEISQPLTVVYPAGWRGSADQLRLIGGNKVLGALQPDMDEMIDAMKAVEKGWPAKQESWQKQGYQIISGDDVTPDYYEGKSGRDDAPYVVGTLRIKSGNRTLDLDQFTIDGATSRDDESVQQEMRRRLNAISGKRVLLNKRHRIVSVHDTQEAAEDAARTATKRDGKTTISEKGIKVEHATRVGPAHRMEGENVSSEKLKDTFKFRGINFGNWLKGKGNEAERQLHLNHAYDSFMDLAEILGVPPEAMSLNGMLGVAIGAQGTGGSKSAAAHFVPGVNEINLTREYGAGSLAHEWAHGLDHYFGRLAGLTRTTEPFLTEHTQGKAPEGIRQAVFEKFRAIVTAMNKRPVTEAEAKSQVEESTARALRNVNAWLKSIRRDFETAKADLAKFDALADRVRSADLGDGKVSASRYVFLSPVLAEIRDLYKATTGRLYSLESMSKLQSNVDHMEYVAKKPSDDSAHVPQQVSTDYANEARKLDREKGGKPYWDTNLEKFARAFDAYVSDTLEAKAAKNSYLSHAGRVDATTPQGTERAAINQAFADLVQTIETEPPDETSNVAMFHRTDATGVEEIRAATAAPLAARPKAGTGGSTATHAGRLARWWQAVNDADSSKAIDENGEPTQFEPDDSRHHRAADALTPSLFPEEPTQQPSPAPAGQAAATLLRAQLAPVLATLRGVTVNIAPNFDALPQAIRDAAQARGALDMDGVFDPSTRTAWLVADRMPNADYARAVLLHEAIGHFGLRGLMGRDLDVVLRQIYLTNGNVRKAADALMRRHGYGKEEAVEEVLADMAAEGRKPALWQRLVAAFKNWLRANGWGGKFADRLGDADVLYLLAQARKFVTEGGRQPSFVRPSVAFSRSFEEDVTEQAGFLAEQAQESGYASPDDWAANDIAGFLKAAEQWREGHSDTAFHRTPGGDTLVSDVLAELAGLDEFFRYRVSKAVTLQGVLQDIDATIEFLGDATRPDERHETGADKLLMFRTMKGRVFYVMERGQEVWFDVSRLDEGDRGSALYHALANYAYNTGKVFVADPAGLSNLAVIRRTHAMLSSALRFGTTHHIEPGPQQLAGIPSEGIAPLEWKGNDIAKIEALVHSVVATAHAKIPQLKDYRYDFGRVQFVDGRGRPVDAERFDLGAGTELARALGAGRQTLRRVVFLQSLVRGQEGQPGILDRVLRGSRQLVGSGGLGQLFHRASQGAPATPSTAEESFLSKIGAGPETVAERARHLHGNMKQQGWRAVLADALVSLRQKAVDQFEALRQLDEIALGKDFVSNVLDPSNKTVQAQASAWIMARMSRGAEGPLEAWALDGQLKVKNGAITVDTQGEGLLPLLASLPRGESDRFLAWIAANRSSDIMARATRADADLKALNAEILNTVLAKRAATAANDLTAFKKLDARHQELKRLKAAAQDRAAVRERLFTPDEVAAGVKMNEGTMADGRDRKAAYADAFIKFKALQTSVLDMAQDKGLINPDDRAVWESEFYVPFYRYMDDTEDVRGPRRVSGLVRKRAFERLKGGTDKLGDLLHNTLLNTHHLIAAATANEAARKALYRAEELGSAVQVSAAGKNVVWVMAAGHKAFYEVMDPRLLEAISAITAPSSNPAALKLMSAFKNALTRGVTLDPAFRIRNLLRDSISAIGISGLSANPIRNVVEGWKATRAGSDTYARMQAGGGAFHFGTVLGDDADKARKLIDRERSKVLDSPKAVWGFIQAMYRGYDDLGSRLENVNRAALFEQMMAGKDDLLAANFAARDLLDFSQRGAAGSVRFLTQVVPFLNARIQGLDKLARSGMDERQRSRLLHTIGAVALASVALYLAYRDDDDFRRREDWDRDTYWWWKIGDQAYRMPKPFEIGAIGTVAERMTELFLDDEATGKHFAERLGVIVRDQFQFNPIPQIAVPLIELWANKDFFTGRDIHTPALERLPSSERIGPRTSSTAIVASRAVGGLMSPVQVDHALRGYLGWLGATVADVIDYGLEVADVRADRSSTGARSFPIASGVLHSFVPNLDRQQSRYVTLFYEQQRAIREAYESYRMRVAVGDREGAQQWLEDNRPLISMRRLADKVAAREGKISAEIRKMERRTMPADEKQAEVDRLVRLKNEIAELAARRIKKSVEQPAQDTR